MPNFRISGSNFLISSGVKPAHPIIQKKILKTQLHEIRYRVNALMSLKAVHGLTYLVRPNSGSKPEAALRLGQEIFGIGERP